MATIEAQPLLALETSGRTMGAALWGPRGPGPARHVVDGARHGVALAVIIRELLAEAGLKPRDLAAVAVSLGPGSWTGLRIGLAAAKALAWGSGIGLVGVPSFEALAWAVRRQAGDRRPEAGGTARTASRRPEGGGTDPTAGWRPEAGGTATTTLPARAGAVFSSGLQPPASSLSLIVPVRNAYSEGIYAAAYVVSAERVERAMEECVLRPGELQSRVEEVLPAGAGPIEVVLCGDLACLSERPAETDRARWRLSEGFEEIPAAALAERAWVRLLRGEVRRSAPDIHSAAPLYLRASDPELKLQRKRAPSGG